MKDKKIECYEDLEKVTEELNKQAEEANKAMLELVTDLEAETIKKG